MSGLTVFLVVLVAAPVLFALAWWSSGRSRGLGRRSGAGDAAQDSARLWANTQKTDRGSGSGGTGGGAF